MWTLWIAAAFADCPDVSVVEASTPWDAERAWMHEPGWFVPLDDPATTRLGAETYPDDTPVLALTHGSETRAWPVGAMAYHHVANTKIDGEPFVVTY